MKKAIHFPLLILLFTASIAAFDPPVSGNVVSNAQSAVAASTYFPLGTGGVDVIPHQIVRANNDRLYIFANQQSSTTVRVYRTTVAGLPDNVSAFAPPIQFTESSFPIGIDAVYDGGNYIHLLLNLQNGSIKDYPFDLTTNAFKPAILLASNGGVVTASDLYVGTSGAAGMQDLSGALHVVYWTNGNHILHRKYSYDGSTNILTPLSSFIQVDTAGSANHPAVAVSPADNSVTVAWVSEADNPPKIRTRTRASNGDWGSVLSASTASVWTSTGNGINIDQGPSLVIDSAGVKHLTYIQSLDPLGGDYGRIHYVRDAGSGWIDQALSVFAHDPALAINNLGEIYIIGHGHPGNVSCTSMEDICMTKYSNGTWGNPQVFAAHSGAYSFDSSPSAKWSAVGFNRPDVIEFLFYSTPYNNPTLFYARVQTAVHIFADLPVPGKEWMEPWITAFYYHGITSGCGTNPLIYCPENSLTRAEMAVFLLRAKHGAGYAPPAASHFFSDMPVPGKEWMEPWVDQYYREGLTTGCGTSPLRYCPEQNVTRAEMAVFVLRSMHAPGWQPPASTGIFTDVPVAGKAWMQPWIEEYYREGITSGCGAGPIYCPENSTTRAEMAVFIDRAFHLYP